MFPSTASNNWYNYNSIYNYSSRILIIDKNRVVSITAVK